MPLSPHLLLGLLCWPVVLGGIFGRWQYVAVRGRVRCGGNPDANVLVHLNKVAAMSQVAVASSTTNRTGHFELVAASKDAAPIRPVLHLVHRCGDPADLGQRPLCARDFSLALGSEFVHSQEPDEVLDLGLVELDKFKFDAMERNCNVILK